ncbi:MAG: M28 family peptidase [Christensenellales bacterium]|jgi:hypothetical protein
MLKKLGSFAVLAAFVLGAAVGVMQFQAPKAPSVEEVAPTPLEQAPAGLDFQRMLYDLRVLSRSVRAAGSPALREAHRYITQRLTDLGIPFREEPFYLTQANIRALWDAYISGEDRWQTIWDSIQRNAPGIGLALNNIVVHLDAPGTDEAILFVAHTDSVAAGPGAFDDAVSVVALLESLRVLDRDALKRDIIVLFSDGEEKGMMGAACHVLRHRETLADIQLVINLDARGNEGALIMFETSSNNLNLVREYAKALPWAATTSIATGVYRAMSNDTDLSVFLRAGLPGMNFAVIGGEHVYHNAKDNYDTFSRDSAYQFMTTADALMRHFGASEQLHLTDSRDGVFFPWMPGRILVMPQPVANVLAYAAALLYVLALAWLLAKRQASVRGMALAFLVQAALAAAAWFASQAVVDWSIRGAPYYKTWGYENRNLIFLALLLIWLGMPMIILPRLPMKPADRLLGTLLPLAALSAALPTFFPAGSYLMSLPALLGLAVLLYSQLIIRGSLLACALAIFAALVVAAPIAYLLFIALSYRNMAIPMALAAVLFSAMAGWVSAAWQAKARSHR